ncbi:hypothetical protein P9J64_02990 [Deltaproteobacteria bacterium IMCC39524]|nr:hypothetical protein [Deltaproteobacteria bacterium IMCC39524]
MMSDIEKSGVKNYFCVSRKVVDRLLNVDISAEQILVYLVLARFAYGESTESTKLKRKVKVRRLNPKLEGDTRIYRIGEFEEKYGDEGRYVERYIPTEDIVRTNSIRLTSASAKAVEKYVGIRRHKAKEIIESLCSLFTKDGERLLYSVRDWNMSAGSDFSSDVAKPYLLKSQPVIKNKAEQYGEAARYVLNNFDEYTSAQIKLPNELISGAKTKSVKGVLKVPLKTLSRLRQHKDEAVRLLLAAYLYRDPREKIIDPYRAFAFDYDLEKVSDTSKATLWKTVDAKLSIAPELLARIAKAKDVSLKDIVDQLAKNGLLCCDVVTCRRGDVVGTIMYVLNAKTVGSFYRKNDSAIASYIEDVFRSKGYEVAQPYGKSYRFNDRYPVISRKGENVDVKGVFSLRIDVGANKAWHSHKQAGMSKVLLNDLVSP